jgi:radical SAM superfamily enzyme YgiQ (UPF0313 family)
MRILLVDNLLIDTLLDVDNPFRPFDLQPHLGLLSLIAVAENSGHEGMLYDPKLALSKETLSFDSSLYREIANDLLRRNPDVIGLTTLGCNFICTLKVAAHLKKMNPDVPVLLGGPHATILASEIIKQFPQFDVVVRNEAELTLLPLLAALPGRHFDGVPGITFRHGNEIVSNPGAALIDDLDTLPWPAYGHYPIRELKLTSLRVEAGRGCPFKCTFCSTASFFGRRYRLKSAGRLCAELDYLNSQFGISHFALMHDLFTVNRAKVQLFCNEMEGRGYTWSCSARMDCVDESLLERMHSAGCRAIYYGVETGSTRMQEVVEKHQDLSLFKPTLNVTQRLGMTAVASFITGYPQEEQADQNDTLDLIGTCFERPQELLKVQLHLLTPEPGTKLIRDFGDSLAYDGHISDFNFPTLESDDSEIMKQYPEVFMNHYYYQSVLPRGQHLFVTSLFEALYSLGFPLLSHLLSYYDRKLSCLVTNMYEWAERTDTKIENERVVIAYIEDRWGSDHYLTSLARHMVTAHQLFKSQAQTITFESNFPDGKKTKLRRRGKYSLSSRVVILRDMHDCPRLLNLIETETILDDKRQSDIFTARRNYLLFLGNLGDKIFRNFVLNETTTDLFEFLAVPRTYRECAMRIHGGRLNLQPLKPFLEELLQLGVLCYATDEKVAPATLPEVRRASQVRATAGTQREASSL